MPDVRLIVRLFDNVDFGTPFRTLVANLADFREIEFNDRTSSVVVERGPNFRTGDAARLWENVGFGGRSITLPPGNYPDLRTLNFNDVASAMSIVSAEPPPDEVVAEDEERRTLRFNLRVIPPAGATLVSVDQNLIQNPTATGTFVGDTGVQVNGTFTDVLVVTIRENGVARQARGQATINFQKLIDFPEIAGLNKNNLAIRVNISNVTQSFTVSGNIVSKTVTMTITTRVIRLLTSAAEEEMIAQKVQNYTVKLQ